MKIADSRVEPVASMNIRRHPARGFTLIELLVVIAILGILIGLATPSMSKFVADWRVNSAMNSLARDMRAARSEAIKRTRPVVFCRANTAGSQCAAGSSWEGGWLVFVDNNFDGNYDPPPSSNPLNGDELLVKQGVLPGIASLEADRSFTSFTFLPNGLMRRSTAGSNTRFTAQSKLGGATPMTEQRACVAVSGRLRKLKTGQDCS